MNNNKAIVILKIHYTSARTISILHDRLLCKIIQAYWIFPSSTPNACYMIWVRWKIIALSINLTENRPGWELPAIVLARPHVCHINNTYVVRCTPKRLYGVLPQLFLIHSFSTLLITLFLIFLVKLLYSFCYLLFFDDIAT